MSSQDDITLTFTAIRKRYDKQLSEAGHELSRHDKNKLKIEALLQDLYLSYITEKISNPVEQQTDIRTLTNRYKDRLKQAVNVNEMEKFADQSGYLRGKVYSILTNANIYNNCILQILDIAQKDLEESLMRSKAYYNKLTGENSMVTNYRALTLKRCLKTAWIDPEIYVEAIKEVAAENKQQQKNAGISR